MLLRLVLCTLTFQASHKVLGRHLQDDENGEDTDKKQAVTWPVIGILSQPVPAPQGEGDPKFSYFAGAACSV